MISFRPVTDDDYEYLYVMNKQTMQEHAEKTYGPWDEGIARRIFAERWRPDTMRIVVIDGRTAAYWRCCPPRRASTWPTSGWCQSTRGGGSARSLSRRCCGMRTGAACRSRYAS